MSTYDTAKTQIWNAFGKSQGSNYKLLLTTQGCQQQTFPQNCIGQALQNQYFTNDFKKHVYEWNYNIFLDMQRTIQLIKINQIYLKYK